MNDIEACQNLLLGPLPAQPNSKGLNNWTALHIAANQGHAEICKVLLRKEVGTDVDARTSLQRTALHLASIKGHFEAVQVLLEAGSDVNASDSEGWTSLHYACFFGCMELIEVLLTANPDLDSANNLGKTAYEVALNTQVTSCLETCFAKSGKKPASSRYSRTLFGNVLLHNSREDRINALLLRAKQTPSPEALRIFNDRPKLQQRPKSQMQSLESDGQHLSTKEETSSSVVEDRPILLHVTYEDFIPICLLGKGSFGEVYYVKRRGTEEGYAMKVLRKDKIMGHNLARYALTERNVMSTIRHPFIVSAHFAFQTAEKLVLVLEYCPGSDLGYYLSREKRFSDDRARVYLCEVLLALEELHNRDIIYRDLKPDNVVLDFQGHAKLTDFGLAKERVATGSLAKSFCGSVAYLSPEVLKRQGHGKAVDWYLLGVLLYEMLVGSPPFFSCNRDVLYENIQKAKLRFPVYVSKQAQSLIRALMERNPANRLGSGPTEAEEIKSHEYFAGIDWQAAYRRELRPPVSAQIRRKAEDLRVERVFGNVNAPNPNRLENWSFVSAPRS